MNQNMKRLAALSTAAILAISATACATTPAASSMAASSAAQSAASKAESQATSSPSADLPTKVSFMTSQAKFNDAYQAVADAVKAETGIEVEFQVVPDNQYQSLLKVKLSTSEVPDIFEYNYPTVNQDLGVQQYCEVLDDQPWVSRLVNPSLIKDPVDGKLYAVPRESSTTYLGAYYNKKVLADVGIVDPQPKTYQEFLDILQTIKDKAPGVTPFYQTNKDTWTTQIFMHGGYAVAMDDTSLDTQSKLLKNELKWTEVPAFKEVLSDYLALFEKGYVNKDNLSAGYDTAPEALATGKAAIYLSIENFVGNVNMQYPDAEIGSFAIPFGDVEKLPIGQYVQGLFVPKAGTQVEKTKAFLNLWSQAKYQDVYFGLKPGFPAYNDVNGGDVAPAVKSLVDNYVSTGKYVYQINDPMAIAAGSFTDLWNFYIEAVNGTKNVDQVFESFQKIYADYMKQQQQPGF